MDTYWSSLYSTCIKMLRLRDVSVILKCAFANPRIIHINNFPRHYNTNVVIFNRNSNDMIFIYDAKILSALDSIKYLGTVLH